MPTCAVPMCRNGYDSEVKDLKAKGIKVSFFKAKSEAQLKEWQAKIKVDPPLTMKRTVCSDHFEEQYMKRAYQCTLKAGLTDRAGNPVPEGTVATIPMGKVTLEKDAVPTIFKNYPSYYQNQDRKKRKAPTKRCSIPPPKKTRPPLDEEDRPHTPEPNTPLVNAESSPTRVEIEHNISPVQPGPQDEPATATENSWVFITDFTMPTKQWNKYIFEDFVSFVHLTPKLKKDKIITFFKDLEKPEVKINKTIVDLCPSVPNSVAEVEGLLAKAESLKACEGTGYSAKKFSVCCAGIVDEQKKRCQDCVLEKDRLRKKDVRLAKQKKKKEEKDRKKKQVIKSLNRAKRNLKNRVSRMKEKVDNLIHQCQQIKKETLDKELGQLPNEQKEAVMACFDAATKKGPRGRRYTTDWVYECLLMRIKSPALYNHIREHNILPVPTKQTLHSYTQSMSCAYGFKDEIFSLLKEKGDHMKPEEKRGIITLDEMKLSPGVKFDKSNLKVDGFVDLGDINSVASGNDLGDHALVVMYQPFRGDWVQSLGCFLTRGNAKAADLCKIILEAVSKMEASGFFVDGITMDGATWNRSVWSLLGVDEKTPFCDHPSSTKETDGQQRKLYFFSDFPHLVKCMRNCMTDKKSRKKIKIQEGIVELRHWEAVLREELKQKGLRQVPKLTEKHIYPGPFDKQNVARAFQFWSRTTAAAMLTYKEKGVDELQDCNASSSFTRRVNDMADAMNSRTPKTALKPGNHEWTVISDFIEYFETIKRGGFDVAPAIDHETKTAGKSSRKQQQRIVVFSDSTDHGLLVTLRATLQLAEYLCSSCSYSYLMTGRLNQDCLESFFGMIRSSCGPDTHPQSTTFAQLFRLLSLYSLVKPPKGSNISGGDLLRNLITLKDLKTASNINKENLERILDEIVLKGENMEELDDVITEAQEHDYIGVSIDEYAVRYVTGFTARHSKRFTAECQPCQESLSKPPEDADEADLLITLKSKGWLTYPSMELVNTIVALEKAFMEVTCKNEMEKNIIFKVADFLNEECTVPLIGCASHKSELTKKIVKFYLIMRMHFKADEWNRAYLKKTQKHKDLRKQAHMV